MKLNRNVYNWPKVMFSSQVTKVRTLLHLSTFQVEVGHYSQCQTLFFVLFYFKCVFAEIKAEYSPQRVFS